MPATFNKLVTVVTGQTITAAERNNEFDNIINNLTPAGIDDASATLVAMQATTDPSGGSQATDLTGELKRLRFPFIKIGGGTNWYDTPAWLSAIAPATPGATATDLNNRLAQLISYLNSTTGATWPTLPVKTLLQYLALTGGTMSGAIAMGTSKITGIGNGSAAQDAGAYGQIKIIQAVTFSTTSSTATTSGSFTDTVLATSITPVSTSNLVFILATGMFRFVAAAGRAYATIKRGSTNIGDASNGLTNILGNTTNVVEVPCSLTAFDSPAAIASTTYTVQIKSDGANSASWNLNSCKSEMILLEVQP